MAAFNKSKIYDAFTTVVFRGTGAFSTIVLYYVVAQFFKPAAAANLFFVVTLSTFLTPILLFGMNTLAIKRLPATIEYVDLIRFCASSQMRLLAVLSAAALCVVAGGLALGRPPSEALIVVSVLVTIPMYSFLGFVCQGRKKYSHAIFILYICNNMILAILAPTHALSVLSSLDDSTFFSLIVFVSSSLTYIITSIIVHRVLGIGISTPIRREHFTPLSPGDRGELFRLWAVLALINVNNWAPQIVYYVSGAGADYAFYSIAERLANAINFFLVVSSFFLSPIIAECHVNGDREGLRDKILYVNRVISLACLPFAAILVFFPHFVLSYFGEAYVGGSTYLALMSLGQTFNVFTGSVNNILNLTGRETTLIKIIAICSVVELVIIVALTPIYGGVIYAVAYMVNLMLQKTLAAVAVWRATGINILESFSLARS